MTGDIDRRAVLAVIALSAILPRSTSAQVDQGGSSAKVDDLLDTVWLRHHGADPSGKNSSVAAFQAALAAGKRVMGAPGDVYLLDAPVVVPAGREVIGNGGVLKIGVNAIGLKLDNNRCKVEGWTIQGNGGLYAVLNTGHRNEFSNNICVGDVGHFFFSRDASDVSVIGNRFLGMTADKEITTAVVMEHCKNMLIEGNAFEQIPVGWGIQIRTGSQYFSIVNNTFLQTKWTTSQAATPDQRVFILTLGSVCLLKRVQVDGKPLSLGYTITGEGPKYTVTFDRGRAEGEMIGLVGYRGAENIQINTRSRTGLISGNKIDGTGDSGIICLGSHLTVINNSVRNCGYAGIAIYGDQDNIVVEKNIIADCSQMDDGRSSPDDPRLASVFAGAILASGEDARITGNTIINTSGTMRYGIRINKADMALRTDGSSTIAISDNRYSGEFADGRIFAPNETSGARINSIAVDGPLVRYAGKIDLDRPWVNVPPSGKHFRTSGFGKVRAIRDVVTKRDGVASLRTVAGEYVDFAMTDAAIFRDCNVTVSFWAKAANGSSYVSVFTELEGLLHPLTAEITDAAWRRYAISFPLTAKLADVILIRCGGTKGHANIQHIVIKGRRL